MTFYLQYHTYIQTSTPFKLLRPKEAMKNATDAGWQQFALVNMNIIQIFGKLLL